MGWFLDDQQLQPPKTTMIGYGGAAGGGKTDALLALAIIICYAYPGAKVGFFRREYTELEGPDGAVQRSQELYAGLGKYNEQQHRWFFQDVGSYIFFRHCQHEKDRTKYQSQQMHLLIIDEGTHFTWRIVDYLITRNRSTVDYLIPFTVMASNPGNIGHLWFQTLFDIHDLSGGEEGPHEQIKHRLNENGKYQDVYFIPAKLEDNEILRSKDPDYERKLEERDPDLTEALRWGNWQTFAGQAFRSWRRERHTCKPSMIPAHWPKWRAIDWGYAKPFCCLWFTRDPDTERVIVYREEYQAGLTDRQQARNIIALSPITERVVLTFADPSIWATKNRQDIVYSTADEYQAEGLICVPADNDRRGGKRKVDRLLENLPDGMPGLMVFDNCVNLIRTLPVLVRDELDPEDVDTDGEDHAYDTLRYGLTNYKIKDREQPKEEQQRRPIPKELERYL